MGDLRKVPIRKYILERSRSWRVGGGLDGAIRNLGLLGLGDLHALAMLPRQDGGSIEGVSGATAAKWEDGWARFRVLGAVVLHASQRLGGAGECRPRDLLMGWIERDPVIGGLVKEWSGWE